MVEKGSLLRIHCYPIRFPRCYQVQWKSRVIANEEHYLVLDKPDGVPVSYTVDNRLENCLRCTAQAIGREEDLYITHRLDQPTSGVLIMGKTKEFVAFFNKLLSNRAKCLEKRYRVLTKRPLPLGNHEAYIYPVEHIGRNPQRYEISAMQVPNSKYCDLKVISSSQITLGSKPDGKGWDNWVEGEKAFESTVILGTGRTHQIRAMAKFLGSPVFGDTLQDANNPEVVHDRIALQAYELRINTNIDDENETFFLGSKDCSNAMEKFFGGKKEVVFRAKEPWWRQPSCDSEAKNAA
eukprot:CAMPEP_0197520926 /NCGR_PEP_ID=MMETSP1318-20131121/6238_1 /TAXON_ID=552666 /ORGANISM="Partenskyella glossopodia, Strain RCC365" /LENGTH=293 /DNA_ID=CAMNT_0043072697 /DNA_START=530 /DNA_END=1411 /DNA_ORIENTATION=-